MKSVIYTVNGNASVADGGIIPLGAITRRYGCNLNLNGNGIVAKGAGYYKTTVSITLVGTASGVATVQLYKDGMAVPGATASVTTAQGTTTNIDLVAITRNYDCNSSVLTLGLSGTAVTVSNVAVAVEKE